MSIEILEAGAELKDLVDTFSNLADVKVRGNMAQNDRTATQQAVSEWLGGMEFF